MKTWDFSSVQVGTALSPELNIEWSNSCTLSKEEFLREFFIFYGENGLSLQNYILSPSSGKKIEMMCFMNECKKQYSSCEYERIMRDFRGPMGVQDPFVHYKTLTRFNQYWEKTFVTFVEYCNGTVEMYPFIPDVRVRTRINYEENPLLRIHV